MDDECDAEEAKEYEGGEGTGELRVSWGEVLVFWGRERLHRRL